MEKYGEFKVMNPTPFKVNAGFNTLGDGKEYFFKPFETKKLYVRDHVFHICTSDKHYTKGLVWINWNEENKKSYNGDFEAYRKDKAKEGLMRAIPKFEVALTYEKQAEAAAELGKHLIEKKSMHPEKFQAKVDQLNKLLFGLTETIIVPEVEEPVEAPEWMGGKKETVKKEVVKDALEVLTTASGVEYKRTKTGRAMPKIDGKFKMVSNDKLKELGIDIN